MIPHESPRNVFASEVYKKDFTKWVDRLGIDGLSFKSFVPQLSLPKVLQDEGYRTVARVSMPVLNPLSHLNRHFDDYKRSEEHTSELQSLMRISYAVFCLKKKQIHKSNTKATHKQTENEHTKKHK